MRGSEDDKIKKKLMAWMSQVIKLINVQAHIR